jgi:hypothetical protein
MFMERFGLRSALMLVGVILIAGMLSACDDPDGAAGDPGAPPAPPAAPLDYSAQMAKAILDPNGPASRRARFDSTP